MIKGLSIIFCCLLLGDLLSFFLHIPVPGNVIGMLLLTIALAGKIVRVEDVKPSSDMLVNNLSLLFVPPGVGLILYFDLLKQELLAIVLSLLLSTLLVLAVVGYIQQRLEQKQ